MSQLSAIGVERNGASYELDGQNPPLPVEPPTIHQEMLASIARTGLLSDRIFIPAISAEALESGNQAVGAEYGAEARRMVIVGPDAIAISGIDEVIRLPSRITAELLGYTVWLRRVTRSSDYMNRGLLADSASPGAKSVALVTAKNKLVALASAHGFDPILKQQGGIRTTRFGIDDIVVQDLRNTKPYAEARQMHSEQAFEGFILAGGGRPRMTEQSMIIAARNSLRRIIGNFDEDAPVAEEQMERFRLISQQQAAMVDLRTDLQPDISTGSHREAQYLRSEVFDELEPAWQSRAACRGPQSQLFYPPAHFEYKDRKLDRQRRAKAICANCPVIQECLMAALVNKETKGIWGGTTEDERKTLLINARV